MQKWTGLLYAALVIAAIALVVVLGRRPATPAAVPAVADAGAPVSDAGSAKASADAGELSDAEAPADPTAEDPAAPGDAGGTLLLNGDAPPALGAETPKSVVFGVILVQYHGAQGAPPSARSRDEALTLAKQIAEEAKKDFKAALTKGDKGSMENAGRIQRGFLEPAPEYVVFSLSKGDVSDPVDTPRGFWIVHRIE